MESLFIAIYYLVLFDSELAQSPGAAEYTNCISAEG